MILNSDWKTILQTATDISTVAEIYSADAVPGDDGFDPDDAIACYSAVAGITYMGNTYTRLVTGFGGVKRSIEQESNTASVTFSNVNRTISRFEFTEGFEGKVLVIRTISRSLSDTLGKSQILFAGRCEKPSSGTKESLTVNATWVLGGPEIKIPRRKFSPDDQEGRTTTDPEFEGFPYIPQDGYVNYSVREGRRKYIFFGPRKTVWKTLGYSSHSDVTANTCVPVVLGAMQMKGVHIAYIDVGSELRMRTAFADGPIYAIAGLRSIQSLLALIGDWSFKAGLVGAANDLPGSVVWPGNTPVTNTAYYSRTAQVISHASNSAVDVDEPAPDLVAMVLGMLMTIPDGSGDWVNTDEWSDNPAAHVWWILTSDDYLALDASWLEADDFTECYRYNEELILRQSASDFLLLKEG